MEDFNSKYTGEQVEALLDIVAEGGSGGGGEGEVQKTTEAEITAMGFTKNLGTITEVKMNGVSKGTSGVVDLGDVQTPIADLATIREGASKGATAVQPSDVDEELLNDSTNPVQNKAVSTAFYSLVQDILQTITLLQGYIDGKVDKVSGKQLSTEDFTTALKTKLEGLSNYNDATIQAAVTSLQTQLNTLTSGNTSAAIESFNEIIAFLDGVTDSESLDSIIASIEQQIAGKQATISDLSTIRSGASKGATAVQPSSLATVATSGSYNDLSNRPTIPAAVTESTVSGWGFTKNTGTYSKPSGGIPKSDLASAVQTSLGKADTAQDLAEDLSSEVSKLSEDKQDKLVSGTNIKTINGTSILGSGNIAISGGSGTITEVKANGTSIATSGVANIPAASTSAYGVTKLTSATNSTSTTLAATASAVKSAYDLANSYKGTVTGVKVNGSTKSPSSGTVDIGNVVTSVKVNGSTYSPSSGVVDLGTISGGGGASGGSSAIEMQNHGTSDTTLNISPNIYHKWDTIASLSLTLASGNSNVVNEYFIEFFSGDTATVLSLPDNISWANDRVIDITPYHIYQVSIINNVAVYTYAKKIEYFNVKDTKTNTTYGPFPFEVGINSDDYIYNGDKGILGFQTGGLSIYIASRGGWYSLGISGKLESKTYTFSSSSAAEPM